VYARERASHEVSHADLRQARQRLLGWYVHTADAADRLLYPQMLRLAVLDAPAGVPVARFGGHAQALAWLDAERDSLVAAVQHAAGHGPRTPSGRRAGVPGLRAEHALDQAGHPWGGLGELVDVDAPGQHAAVAVTELRGDDAGGFLVGGHRRGQRVAEHVGVGVQPDGAGELAKPRLVSTYLTAPLGEVVRVAAE
jgi:hypothetical protein